MQVDEENGEPFVISLAHQFTINDMSDPVQHTNQLIDQVQGTPESIIEPATTSELQQIIKQLNL